MAWQSLADPANFFFFGGGGGQVLAERPKLPPFSSFSTDLGQFILRLLNFDIYVLFYVKFLSLFSLFFLGGGQTEHFMPLWGDGPKCPPPLDPPVLAIIPPVQWW